MDIKQFVGETEIEHLKQVLTSTERTLNEADTRHQIIDIVLHSLLAWPRSRTSVEEYIKPGYADYVLKRSNGDSILFIEAKKGGGLFRSPRGLEQ